MMNNISKDDLKKLRRASRKKKVFPWGNYDRYYGYRIPNTTDNTVVDLNVWDDKRIHLLKESYFQNKSILDIGCNAGYVTTVLSDIYHPHYILGIDIDDSLIKKARWLVAQKYKRESALKDDDLPSSCYSLHFRPYLPLSLDMSKYPHNLFFKTENIISDHHYGKNYDTILCLSTIKWIHLNYGDSGVIQLFDKIYSLLVKGGIFIFEPQPWSSYKKKRTINEHVYKVYHEIQIHPQDFESILIKKGFKLIDTISPSCKKENGFTKRTLFIYQKE
ncbi:hypothetical protein WA158_003075 [Blastocystis sp. Blastoise]